MALGGKSPPHTYWSERATPTTSPPLRFPSNPLSLPSRNRAVGEVRSSGDVRILGPQMGKFVDALLDSISTSVR